MAVQFTSASSKPIGLERGREGEEEEEDDDDDDDDDDALF